MLAREWLHANHKRLVTVKFGPEAAIYTVDRKGEKLRSFSLKNIEVVTVEESAVISKSNKIFKFIKLLIVFYLGKSSTKKTIHIATPSKRS